MRLDIPYGDGYLPLDLSRYHDATNITSKSAAGIPDIDRHIQQKFSEVNLFSDLIKFDPLKDKISIIIEEPQRITNFALILRSLINSLQTASLKPQNIQFILSASRPYSLKIEDTAHYFNDYISDGCEFHVHNPSNEMTVRYLGDDSLHSIPVHMNSRYIDSTYRISLSPVVQSSFTGTTGGLLSIAPGLCGIKTQFHLAKRLTRQDSTPFKCDPEYLSLLKSVIGFAPPHLYLNLVQDSKGTLAHVCAGNLEDVGNECIEISRNLATSGIRRRSDVVVVGAGGKGYDATLYDACECLSAAFTATRTGGTILLIAECRDGVGPDGFLEGLSNAKSDSDLRVMCEMNFKIGMERALLLRKVMESREIVLCSRLRESLVVEKVGCTSVHDPQDGLEMIVRTNGTRSHIAVIEQAPFVYPVLV